MVLCKKYSIKEVHLCRIDTCEYWDDCKKEFEDNKYNLLPSNHPYAIKGLQWKKIKSDSLKL